MLDNREASVNGHSEMAAKFVTPLSEGMVFFVSVESIIDTISYS